MAVFDRGRVEVGRLSKSAAGERPGWRRALFEHVRVLGLVGRELADYDPEEYRKLAVFAAWEYPILEVRHRGMRQALRRADRGAGWPARARRAANEGAPGKRRRRHQTASR